MVKANEAITELMDITPETIRKYFCANATDKEVGLFLNIAKTNGLNPFNREIYLVKYGDNPASILTGYEVYLKRAERSEKWAGFKAWTEGEGGTMKACIEVYRKDWQKPLYHEVEYSEYVSKTRDGKPMRLWADKPKTMLKKVVISQGMRMAFPLETGGIPYTPEEADTEMHDQDADPELMPRPAINTAGAAVATAAPAEAVVTADPAVEHAKEVLNAEELATADQIKVLVATASKKMSRAAFYEEMKKRYGVEKTADLKVSQVTEWIAEFRA